MEQGTVVKITIKTWEQNSLKIYILQKCIASAVRHFNQIVFCMSMGALASVIWGNKNQVLRKLSTQNNHDNLIEI